MKVIAHFEFQLAQRSAPADERGLAVINTAAIVEAQKFDGMLRVWHGNQPESVIIVSIQPSQNWIKENLVFHSLHIVFSALVVTEMEQKQLPKVFDENP